LKVLQTLVARLVRENDQKIVLEDDFESPLRPTPAGASVPSVGGESKEGVG
jgi:hypothetical protein